MSDNKYVLYELEDPEAIKKLLKYSTVAFEGLNLNKNNIEMIVKALEQSKCKSTREDSKFELLAIAGVNMNKTFRLTGDNAYEDDFPILCVCPITIDGFLKVETLLRMMGARWFKDVVGIEV